MSAPLDFVIEDDRWTQIEGLQALASDVIGDASKAVTDFRPGSAVILLTDNAAVHTLNRAFRGKDKPTNVLSFPTPDGEDYPGDIALAYEVCAQEAEAAGKSMLHHAVHLILHGVLHLNDYDHQIDDEAEAMEAMETTLLAGRGIADPYAIGTD